MGASVVVATDGDQDKAHTIAKKLSDMLWATRDQLKLNVPDPAEAVKRAIASAKSPVVLVEMGDNIGGGSAGDATFISGDIGETGGARKLTVDSTSAIILYGANNWTGGTEVTKGILIFGGDYNGEGYDPNLPAGTSNILVGTNGYVVQKSSALGAGPILVTAFPNLVNGGTGAGPFAPRGVDNVDPAAAEGYFIGVDNATFSTLMLRRVSNPGSATPSSRSSRRSSGSSSPG